MRLWSWHTPDFSLIEGKVDHTKSKYYRKYPEAYEELHRRLGTDQLIWCYLRREDHTETPITCETEREWELEVPEDEDHVLFTDDLVWNKILGEHFGFPPRLLRNEVMKRNPCDAYQEKQFEQQLADKLRRHKPSWDKLIIETPSEAVLPGFASALVRHPIPGEWVIKPDAVATAFAATIKPT